MFSPFVLNMNAASFMEVVPFMGLWGCTSDRFLLGEHGVDRNILVLQIEEQPPFLD
jgi:hypothetical protein